MSEVPQCIFSGHLDLGAAGSSYRGASLIRNSPSLGT